MYIHTHTDTRHTHIHTRNSEKGGGDSKNDIRGMGWGKGIQPIMTPTKSIARAHGTEKRATPEAKRNIKGGLVAIISKTSLFIAKWYMVAITNVIYRLLIFMDKWVRRPAAYLIMNVGEWGMNLVNRYWSPPFILYDVCNNNLL